MNWDELSKDDHALLDSNGAEQGVWLRPSLVRALRGNGNAAIVLSQLLFRSKIADEESWFPYSQEELEQKTGIQGAGLSSARKLLQSLKLLDWKRKGIPPRQFFKLNLSLIATLIRDIAPCNGRNDEKPKKSPKTVHVESIKTVHV